MPYKIRLSSEKPDSDTPSALEAYQALRKDPSAEPGKRIKEVFERLREDPGGVRRQSARYRPDWWMAEVEMPDESIWWIAWKIEGDNINVRWIGPRPGSYNF